MCPRYKLKAVQYRSRPIIRFSGRKIRVFFYKSKKKTVFFYKNKKRSIFSSKDFYQVHFPMRTNAAGEYFCNFRVSCWP